MALTRPLKEGSVTTYQQKVALGFPDILASEMDADLDTIYAAWNGGVGTANLIDGSVTTAKLAPNLQTWQTGAGNPITPIDATKIVAVPGDATMATLLLGNASVKARLQESNVTASFGAGLFVNRNFAASDAQDDATKPSWACFLSAANNQFVIQRSPAGSTAQSNLLMLDGTGNLTALTNLTLVNAGARANIGTRCAVVADGGTSTYLMFNEVGGPNYDTAKASWRIQLVGTIGGSDGMLVQRAPQSSGAYVNSMIVDNSGSLIMLGPIGQKSTGTTWANPSDRRLKDDIADYSIGLAAIAQLQPRTFVYNGKGGSPAGLRGYGFIADEVVPVMPEMVGVRAGKLDPDDENETEIQTLDQSNLILALVNAVKEVAARVTALEAR